MEPYETCLKDDQGRRLYVCKECEATTPSPFLFKDDTCQWCRNGIQLTHRKRNNACNDCGSELHSFVCMDDHIEKSICDTCEIVIYTEAI